MDGGASTTEDSAQTPTISSVQPSASTSQAPTTVEPQINAQADPYQPLDTVAQPAAPATVPSLPQTATFATAVQQPIAAPPQPQANTQPQPEWLRSAANDATQLSQSQPIPNTAPPTNVAQPQTVQPPQVDPAAVAQLQQIYAVQDNQVAAISKPPAQQTAQPTVKPMADVSLPQQPNQPAENIGSELGGLEDVRNPVISDAQFNVLAKSAQQPVSLPQQSPNMNISANSPSPEPIHDIRPAKANLSDITKVGVTPTIVTSNTQELPEPTVATGKGTGMKVASAVATIAAIAIVSIYVWQINYPNLAVKVAGAKSGLAVSLPTYMPAGWRLSGDISASPGLVQYNLKSGEGNQSIAVTQARSDWDSQALAENYLGKKTQQYLALQAQGLTIYVYGGNSATWVNHGSWYKLEGKGPDINQDQIIKIATSL